MRDKVTAGVLSILLGSFGAHKFYLNSVFMGVTYILFSWTFIPMIVGIIEGILILLRDQTSFDQEYNSYLL
jgi:TM2 domain-containing membrane protein YozV